MSDDCDHDGDPVDPARWPRWTDDWRWGISDLDIDRAPKNTGVAIDMNDASITEPGPCRSGQTFTRRDIMGDTKTASFKLAGAESAEVFNVEARSTPDGPMKTIAWLECPTVFVKGMDVHNDPPDEDMVEPWVRIAFDDGQRSVRFQLDLADARTLGRVLLSIYARGDGVKIEKEEPTAMLVALSACDDED
jgi:hypothetical protein